MFLTVAETFSMKGHILYFVFPLTLISESISVIQHAISYAGLCQIYFVIMMSSLLI